MDILIIATRTLDVSVYGAQDCRAISGLGKQRTLMGPNVLNFGSYSPLEFEI